MNSLQFDESEWCIKYLNRTKLVDGLAKVWIELEIEGRQILKFGFLFEFELKRRTMCIETEKIWLISINNQF